MQAIFQDPGGSLNGRMQVGTIVGEPLEVLRGVKGPELVERTAQLLLSVGLKPRRRESMAAPVLWRSKTAHRYCPSPVGGAESAHLR